MYKRQEEDHPSYINTSNPLSVYANAKIDGEILVSNHPNHVIIRTGPLYGKDANGKWDKRIRVLIEQLSSGKPIERATNLFKTFVHVNDLSRAIVEMIEKDYIGIIHVGPLTKESYYTFSCKIAQSLGFKRDLILQAILEPKEAKRKGIPLDTSLNTQKCFSQLSTKFRGVGMLLDRSLEKNERM